MRQIVQKMTVLAVAMLIALPLSAKEDKAEKKQKRLENHPVLSILKLPKEITLTAEQQPKFDAVKTEFEGKLKELAAKQDEILTAEQKKARQQTQKTAKAAGKNGKELRSEVAAAVNLTDDQKKKQKEVVAEVKEVQDKVREKLNGFLTEEQKTHLKTPGKAKKQKATA